MYGNPFQVRVVFFQFQPFRRVLPILGGDVTGHAGNPRCLLLGAFQNHLLSCFLIFLCHVSKC